MSQPGGKRPAENGTESSHPQPDKKAKGGPAQVTIDRPDGGRYTGEVDDQGRPHGCGTEYRADGSKWICAWRDGQMQGRGSVVWRDGVRFEGDFVNGARNGLGQYIWPDKRCYAGGIVAGRFAGLGVMWDSAGALLHCGKWEDHKFIRSQPVPLSQIATDSGAHQYLSAAVLALSAADRARTLLLPDGGHYIGDFNAELQQHDEGVAYRADGSERARGQWRDGKMHGRGKFVYSDGGSYEGEFTDGQRDGHGTYKWPDGAVYEGEWAGGDRSGLGSFRQADGRVYEGEWAKDKCSGFGVQWDKDGNVVACGRWADDQLIESRAVPLTKIPVGTHLSAAGRYLSAKDRARTLLLPDGGLYCGEISEGYEQSGLGVAWRADGELKERGRWADGKLAQWCAVPLSLVPADVIADKKYAGAALLLPGGGRYVGPLNEQNQSHGDGGVEYHADGSEYCCGQWRDGKLHGRGKLVYPDGSYEGEFVDGKMNGRGRMVDSDGGSYDGEFVDGQRSGQGTLRWSNGDVYEGHWVHSRMSGLGTFRYADGRVYEGEWALDRKIGLGIQWDKDGKMIACGRWAYNYMLARESCAVPLSKIPIGKFLSAAARRASLLFPDGGFYIGELDARHQRHGHGSMHSADGRVQTQGRWRNDVLQVPYAAAPAAAPVVPFPLGDPAPPAAAVAVASAAAAAASSSSGPVPQGHRKALLIGNNNYEEPISPLRCCRNDAEDMRTALAQLGFQCTLLLDGTRRQMTDAIRNFIASLHPRDIVFIHFSGHGEEKGGRTYLLPVDYGRGEVSDDAVCLENVQTDLNAKDCHLINILMLDCCRYDSDDATFRAVSSRSAVTVPRNGQAFARKPTSGQFLIAFSSDRGTVAHESDRNGWFTGCVLGHLSTPGLQLEQIFKRATKDLLAKSQRKQCSWTHSTMEDDVVLCDP